MSAPDIKLTRNACGLARLPLIGGRFDGGEWVAIIGAPVCIAVKRETTKVSVEGGYTMEIAYASIFGTRQKIEGDEWKVNPKVKGNKKDALQRFALYAPKVENGRASLALYFVEEVEL